MPTPKPQTTSSEIADTLLRLALNAGSHEAVEMQVAQILKACNDLQKHDVVTASLLKSNLYALMGNQEKSEYWVSNAARNGGSQRSALYVTTNLFLLGRISEAYGTFDASFKAAAGNGAPLALIQKALSVGWFKKAAWVLGEVNDKEVPAELKALIAEGLAVSEALSLSEQTAGRIMDEAYGLLTRQRLIWLDSLPEIRFLSKELGGPAIFVSFRIAVSPAVAADLSWNLALQLVELGLEDKGLMVSFQGTILENAIDPYRRAAIA